MWSILAAVFGIGLLLFVHETGHYLACRLARVRVEVYSLGFGPRLAGFRRGGTDFRISWIPLGGYVRPAGEDMTRPPQPGELGAAAPGWRFFIYSGGILMNFLFALVLIPLLFRIGVPMTAPVAGTVTPGSPAWHAGIQSGDRMLALDGGELRSFQQFLSTVALSRRGSALELELEGPDGRRRSAALDPEYDAVLGARAAGVDFPMESEEPLQIALPPGSGAEPPFADGEHVLAIDGVDVSTPFAAEVMAVQKLRGDSDSLSLRLRRADGSVHDVALTQAAADPAAPLQIGVRRLENRVREVRGSLAAVLAPEDQVIAANGAPVLHRGDLLAAALRDGGLREITRRRDGQEQTVALPAPLPARQVDTELWIGPYEQVVVSVSPGSPAARAGMRTGDRVLRVDNQPLGRFEDLAKLVQAAQGHSLRFLLARPGQAEPEEVTVTAEPLPHWNFNLAQRLQRETVQRDNLVSALTVGLAETRRQVAEVFLMIQRMFSGDVDRRNLGGIITIGQMTHANAEAGLLPLLFFLAILSLNLGVLNLLPIPALDGGHLLFILVEMLRGRPLSERTQGWFNLAGLVLVVGLLVFALSHDIERLLGS